MVYKRKTIVPSSEEGSQQREQKQEAEERGEEEGGGVKTLPLPRARTAQQANQQSTPARRAANSRSWGCFLVLIILLVLVTITFGISLYHLSALQTQIDFQFSDWVFSSAQDELRCSNENTRDRAFLGNTDMYRLDYRLVFIFVDNIQILA